MEKKKNLQDYELVGVYDWMDLYHAINLIDRIHATQGISMGKICELAGINPSLPSKWRKSDPEKYAIKEETQIKLWKLEKEFFGEC